MFRFRQLKRHEATVQDGNGRKRLWELACNLIAEYFAAVGGFRLADDAVVTAWADALASYSPAEIRAAIAAKAKSLRGAVDAAERRFKLDLRGQAATFPARLDYWLDLAEHARHRRPIVDDALRSRLDSIDRGQASSPVPRGGPGPVGDRRGLLAEHLGDARRHEADNRAQLARLTERQRATVARAAAADFASYVRAFDPAADPGDEQFTPLRLEREVAAAIERWGRSGGHDSAIVGRAGPVGAIAAPPDFLAKSEAQAYGGGKVDQHAS